MGLVPHRKGRPERLTSLAVISIGCIGDTLLLDGPLRDFKRVFPDCGITMFASSSNAQAAQLLDSVDTVVRLPLDRPDKAVRSLRASGPFDACMDTGQWARISALFAWAAPARFTIGFRTPGQHRHFAFDVSIPHRDSVHEIDNFRRLFAPLGVNCSLSPAITPPVRSSATPRSPYAVLHMFPSGRHSSMKKWPEDRWVKLAGTLAESGLDILFSGAPGDADEARHVAARTGNPRVRSIAGETSLSQLAALLGHARIVVSVNTGIMHLAASVGAPLISLNGPTSIKRWGALTAPHKAVSLTPGLDCAPCLNLGFEYGCMDNRCMRAISLDSVLKAFETLSPK
jgi:ADP-heptose:LPS heptosyltransferase